MDDAEDGLEAAALQQRAAVTLDDVHRHFAVGAQVVPIGAARFGAQQRHVAMIGDAGRKMLSCPQLVVEGDGSKAGGPGMGVSGRSGPQRPPRGPPGQ